MNLIKYADSVFKKHGPKILTGLGVAGLVTTTILAIEATPKAVRLIEEKKKEEHKESLTKKETVSLVWKCYIPTGVSLVASAACIMGAYSEGARRNAALATAYSLTQSYLDDYRSKTKEVVGEKKEKQIQQSVAEERMHKNPITPDMYQNIPGTGELCYDAYFDEYFRTTADRIDKARAELNTKLKDEMSVTVNEFYKSMIGKYEPLMLGCGENLGWDINDASVEIYRGIGSTDDDRPCLTISYGTAPHTLKTYCSDYAFG